MKQNLIHIASIPFSGIKQVRIHWLLDAVKVTGYVCIPIRSLVLIGLKRSKPNNMYAHAFILSTHTKGKQILG